MAPTGSPWDRAVLVPVESVWGVHGLADGHAPHPQEAHGGTQEEERGHNHAEAHEDEHGEAHEARRDDGHGETHDHAHEDSHAAHGEDHADAHGDEHGHADADGEAHDDEHDHANDEAPSRALGPPYDPAYFPGTPAVIVVPHSIGQAYALQSAFTRDAGTMAFLPGAVLSQLYALLGDVRQAMSLMSLVAQGLVAASVLTGLVMLLRLFQRHIALLRALGAPTRFLVALVWSYGATLLVLGGVLGLGLGWATAAVLSGVVAARTGVAIPVGLGWPEVHLVAGFVAATASLALLPAWALTRGTGPSGTRP
ncbi:FtsX-like permease family protein [Rhodobacteraceae bacterium CCMM004]|nr:FtsX-like permease family protein [Rhodobacteraceae bacterium CCMM004]